MNFETKHKVENNIFSVEVDFTEYGTPEMSEEEEQALFNDLGDPVINLGQINFSGRFKVDGDKRVIPAEASDGTDAADKVSFIVNAKKLQIAKGFTALYQVDARSIADSEVGKILNTKRLVAEAKCLLFQQEIHKAIKEAVEELKKQRTRFETEVVATLTV